MRPGLLALLAFATATAAAAQEFDRRDLDRLDGSLARVTTARAYFYRDDAAGCPALVAKCRRRGYVRASDVVLVDGSAGALLRVTFGTGARMTEGYLERSALVPVPAPAQPLSAWRGHWVRDDQAELTVASGTAPDMVSFTGEALWGTHDPDRVARGGVHTGEVDEQGTPVDGRVMLGGADPTACRLAVRLIGPYLAVVDNTGCGGQNVSFSGLYRKRAPR